MRLGRGLRDVLAVEEDAPGAGAPHPDERFDELALAVAVDTGDAEDLALAHLQVEAGDGGVAAVVEHLEPLDGQDDVAGLGRTLLDLQRHVAPDHHAGQPGAVGGVRRRRADDPAAAQDRDPVADRDRLAQLVGDEDDRRPVGGEVLHHAEQLVGLGRGEHGRRFVEDEDLDLAVERLEDLDPLLHADGEVLDEGVRVDGEPEAVRHLADAGTGGRGVEERPVGLLGPEHDVLGDGEDGDELEVLVDHPDAAADGVARALHAHRLAAQEHLAAVGLVEAEQHLDQRRLAGAVLAQQAEDLAAGGARC